MVIWILNQKLNQAKKNKKQKQNMLFSDLYVEEIASLICADFNFSQCHALSILSKW